MIVAFPAAEHEIALVLDVVDFSPHQVHEVSLDHLRAPAMPFAFLIRGQQIVVLVPTIQEQQRVGQRPQPLEDFFLAAVPIPDEAEIAADNQGIPFFHLPHIGRGQAGQIPMQVAGDVNHR